MSDLTIGYAAMLEQFHPTEAVALTALAEEHGFSGCMAADHFQPWVPQQGQASFVWNVLTALGERTTGDIGPGVTCPTFRLHPAMVAQASATLEAMYPGRTGSGSARARRSTSTSSAATGPRPPSASTACSRRSRSSRSSSPPRSPARTSSTRARTSSSSRPGCGPCRRSPPTILVATAGPVTAKRTGKLADGLITVGAPLEKIGGLFAKFDEGAREAGKDPDTMPKVLQLHLSWAPTDEEALANAMVEWPNGGMKFPKADIRSPFEFEQMAKLVRPEDFEGRMVISSDPDVHRAYIQRFVDLGFDRVYLHNVGRNQREWIEVFGRDVLPKLHR